MAAIRADSLHLEELETCMPECPFCRAEVEEDLVLYGGSCPHCFNAIPGEETPTDPGGSKKAEAKKAESGGPGMGRVVAAAALLAIVGGGIFTQIRGTPLPGEELDGEFELFENSADPEAQAQAMSDALKENAPEEPEEPAQAAVVSMPSAPSNQQKTSYPASSNHASRAGTTQEPATLSSGGPVVIPRRLQLAPDALSNPDEIAEAITHTLRANNGRFEQCYNQRLKELEGLKGSWMVSFTVQPSGSPSSIRVRALTVRDKSLEACLKRQMTDLHFPKITVASAFARKYHFGSG